MNEGLRLVYEAGLQGLDEGRSGLDVGGSVKREVRLVDRLLYHD